MTKFRVHMTIFIEHMPFFVFYNFVLEMPENP